MFTGIIESTARVVKKTDTGLVLERPAMFDDVKIGASISVNGACLSVVQRDTTSMSFDVVAETWERTNLGDLQIGDKVNVERALRADARFEGHVVQGHVEDTGVVAEAGETLTIELPEDLWMYVIPKGSIAINGVSLTIASVASGGCSVALIPHTLKHTTLGTLQPGDRVNIETDILGRTILIHLSRKA